MTFSLLPTNIAENLNHIFSPSQPTTTYIIANINWKQIFRAIFPNRKLNFVTLDATHKTIEQIITESKIKKVEVFCYCMPYNKELSDACEQNQIKLTYLEPALFSLIHVNHVRLAYNIIAQPKIPFYIHHPDSTLCQTIQNFPFGQHPALLEEAQDLIQQIKALKLSHFNIHPSLPLDELAQYKHQVLVVGQADSHRATTFDRGTFKVSDTEMLQIARRDFPEAKLIYKPYPTDASASTQEKNDIESSVVDLADLILEGQTCIHDVLPTVQHVYTSASQAGFDALLYGVPVTTFGLPWYAGWGLTDDRHPQFKAPKPRTLAELVVAACIIHTYCFDPILKRQTTIQDSLNSVHRDRLVYIKDAIKDYKLKNARNSMKNLDTDVSFAQLTALTTEFPQFVQAWTTLAELHQLQQQYAPAIACYNKAIELDPQEGALYQARCMARLKNGEFNQATDQDFKKALVLSKTKNELIYQYFSYLWEKEPVSDLLFKSLDHALSAVPAVQKQSKEYGKLLLLKACMLNETRQHSTALKTQKQALALGAADSTMLALRHTAWKHGNPKALSDYEATYYPKLLEFTDRFRELVLAANGSVCLVGNAPSLIGSNRGDEIDQHQLVVRFNNYSTDYPFSEDYGIKTDVWVRMPFHPYVKRDADPDLKLVMFTGSNRLYRPYTEWHGILEYIERGFPVQFFPSSALYELQKALGAPPTAGLMLCYMLYKIVGPLRPEQCLGFSFTDPIHAQGSYHYSDQNAASSARHDWDREAEFFNTIRQKDPTQIVVPRVFRQKGTDRRLVLPQDLHTSTTPAVAPVSPATSTNTTLTTSQPAYDRIISVSPGLADYQIYGKKVELISGAKTERHLKWLENPLKGEPADLLKALQPHEKVCVLGFGRAKTGLLAKQLAQALHADFRLVEYGLISAMSLPSEKKFNFSLILDDCGIFYDTTVPSQIENMLLRDDDILQPAMLQQSRKLMDTIVGNNITKYNNSGDIELLTERKNHRILVIDQTAGDNSIVYGQCETYSFRDMLLTALDQPNSDVILKIHPETAAGAKNGNLTSIQDLLDRPNLKVIGQQCNIVSLIKQVDEVYVMTSGVGLEALMIGKPVSCFGVPFYSGWGLTNDRVPVPNPRRQLSVESLFAATFLKYNLFYHPETQQPCSMDACIEWIVQNKPFFEPIKLEW